MFYPTIFVFAKKTNIMEKTNIIEPDRKSKILVLLLLRRVDRSMREREIIVPIVCNY